MTLKELRKLKKLTQKECAKYLNIPLRTYQNYENNQLKAGTIKYNYIIDKLNKYNYIDENHGILTIEQITITCKNIFDNFDIDYCYLFGSYAKGSATENSDVDLLISTPITGINFYDLIEAIREGLNKKIDALNHQQLSNNTELINEILRDGIKIYG